MGKEKKTLPAKLQHSEVIRIRLNGPKYALLCSQAKQERRKITNLAQVMIEEGLEKRAEKGAMEKRGTGA